MEAYKPYSAGRIEWIYPYEEHPPTGKKINILQEGGVEIHGEWKEGCGYVAWQHLFKRNKEKEKLNQEYLSAKAVNHTNQKGK